MSSTPCSVFVRCFLKMNRICVLISLLTFGTNLFGKTVSTTFYQHDFEKKTSNYIARNNANTLQWMTTDSYTNQGCLQVNLDELAPWDPNQMQRGTVQFTPFINIKPGTQCSLSFAVKTNHLFKLVVQILFDRQAKQNIKKEFSFKTDGPWKKLTLNFEMPQNTDKVKFQITGMSYINQQAKTKGLYNPWFRIDHVAIQTQSAGLQATPDGPLSTKILNQHNLFVPTREIMSDPITIDGNITPSEWSNTPWISDFREFLNGKPAQLKTSVKLIRTPQGFYVAFRAQSNAAQSPVKTTVKKYDTSDIFKDDTVSLFITPEFGSKDVRQFTVNAYGTQFDSKPLARSASHWNTKWQSASRKTVDGFEAELFIPHQAAGTSPQSQVCGINFTREAKLDDGTKENSSWAGLIKSFLTYPQFGRLIHRNGPAQMLPIRSVELNQGQISVKLNNKNIKSIEGWLNTYEQVDFKSWKYHQNTFKKQNSTLIVKPQYFDGGEQFITLYTLKNNQVDQFTAVSFRTEDSPRYMKMSYEHPVLIPGVKKEQWQTQLFQTKRVKSIHYYPSKNGYELKTAEKIKKYLFPNAIIVQGAISDANLIPAGTLVLGSLQSPSFVKAFLQQKSLLDNLKQIPVKQEGYILKLLPEGRVILAGQDGAGAYYAFRTLQQIYRHDPKMVLQTAITDWPDHPGRGYSINLRHPILTKEQMETFIYETIAGFKYNQWMIQPDRAIQYDTVPELTHPKFYYTKEQIRQAIQFANENFIRVLPRLGSHSHEYGILRAYPEMAEFPDTKSRLHKSIACVNHPNYYNIKFKQYKEIYELFGKQDFFHIKHDEIRYQHQGGEDSLTACPRCGDTPKWKIIRDDYLRVEGYLKKLGVKNVAFWGDMFNPQLNGGARFGNIAQVMPFIPKDNIAMHWVDENINSINRGAEAYFQKYFKRVIWSHNRLESIDYLPNDPDNFLAFYSNDFSPMVSWQTWGYVEERKNNYQYVRFAHDADVFWNIKSYKPSYYDFEYQKGTALSRITSRNTISSQNHLKSLPLTYLASKSNLVHWNMPGQGFDFSLIQDGLKTSRFKALMPQQSPAIPLILMKQNAQFTFTVNKQSSQIAVLQSAHIRKKTFEAYKKTLLKQFWTKGKPVYGCKIGEYILQYQDGTQHIQPILLGYNTYAWNTSDKTRLQYDTAETWNIPYFSQPVSAFVYVIKNPYPDKTIQKITMKSTQPYVDLALFSAATVDSLQQ